MKKLIAYGLLIIFIAVPVAFFMGWLNISWLAFFLIMLGIIGVGNVVDLAIMIRGLAASILPDPDAEGDIDNEAPDVDNEAPDVDNSRVPEDYDQPSKIIWYMIGAIALIGLPVAFFMSWVNISWLTFFLIMIGIFIFLWAIGSIFKKYSSWEKRSKESFFKKYNIKQT